jgi:hypothetical protein
MTLNKERIAELVSEIGSSAQRGNKFIAMRVLRENLGFSLREAKECVEEHAYDDNGLAKIRGIFEETAGLKSGRLIKESKPDEQVFENEHFRLALKKPNPSYQEFMEFTNEVFGKIYGE